MAEIITKEVYFYKYCPTCAYFERKCSEDPCNDCLNNPSNDYSHRPVNWKQRPEYE